MRSYLALVASLASMISCGLSVRAAIEEHVAAASPSQVSRPAAGKAEEKGRTLTGGIKGDSIIVGGLPPLTKELAH